MHAVCLQIVHGALTSQAATYAVAIVKRIQGILRQLAGPWSLWRHLGAALVEVVHVGVLVLELRAHCGVRALEFANPLALQMHELLLLVQLGI